MPLFLFKCSKCGNADEKFFHSAENADKANILCSCCDGSCSRQLSSFKSKLQLDAKELYEQKIKPEVDEICKRIANGSDRDFLDIYGEE